MVRGFWISILSLAALSAAACSALTMRPELQKAPPQTIPTERDRPFTKEQAKQDIDLAKQAIIDIHPGYDRYTSAHQLDLAWAALEADIEAGVSVETLYVGLSRVLTEIRCDHTKAELPSGLLKRRTETASFFPFRIMATSEGFYVYSAIKETDLRPGDRVTAINNLAIADIADEIYELIPVDGFTDHAKRAAFEATGEFLGSGFEHFYPLIYGDWLTTTIDVVRDGEPISVQATPIDWTDWRNLDWPGPAYRSDFVDSVQFDVLDGVGYLRIDTFVNYRRPVDPAEIYRPIFQRLQKDQIKTLIIDTRFNGGGSTDAVIGLLGFVSSDTSPLFASKRVRTIDLSAYAEQIETWDPRALTPDPTGFTARADGWFEVLPKTDPIALAPIPPQTPEFKGDLIALTSRANASGVTMLLSSLRDRADAILIGEATGGSSEGPTAGQIFFLELPHSGIRIRIPWQLQRSNVEVFEKGLGVTPDIALQMTASDRLADRDPVLEVALNRARP
ncbi:MAG: S41 family peptidase [Pseudomonadota bacterium]